MSDAPEPSDTCVVCFKTVELYSIGECDHPVCYECSTRMRVLCLQNECPICRQELLRVVFTESVQPYKVLRALVLPDKLFERQYKIGFANDEIKLAYERVLEHRCKVCPKLPPFRTFNLLSDHVRKVHERYFCDLCVKHLKIFTSERKCYTRQELAHHRRKGDVDDTSHRGHPLCEFCEQRYMDTDELYRHLRKEHLYCHLCDADGRNLYYASHSALAHHFRTDHFLCEEGECAGQHLTAVFRTDIDLKAHKASVHGRGLTRGASRQARTLELQFNITPHQFAGRQPRCEEGPRGGGGGGREAERGGGREAERGGGREAGGEGGGAVSEFAPAPPAPIDTGSVQQFPRLSTAPPAPPSFATHSRVYQGSGGIAKTKENFPALEAGAARAPPPPPAAAPAAPRGPSAAAMLRTNGKPSVSVPLHGHPGGASNFRLTGGARAGPAPAPSAAAAAAAAAAARRAALYEDFPSLEPPDDDRPSLGAAAPQPPKVGLVSSEQMQAMKSSASAPARRLAPPPTADAFPALSAAAASAPRLQWITHAKPKEKPKPTKVAPAPDLAAPAFNAAADFPHLALNNKSKNKKNNPERHPPVAPKAPAEEPPKPATKKEKKKQNNIKTIALEELSETFNGQATKKNKNSPAWGDGRKIGKENKSENDRPADVGDGERPSEKLSNGESSYSVASDEYPPLAGGKRGSGLTFTNSAGETFSAPLHTYIPPPDFDRRNAMLVKRFADALGADAMEEFKSASRSFRTGAITAERFYARCERALGGRLRDLLPELVALLPDIGRQQALALGRDTGLDMCAACGQLLAPHDTPAHRAAHWPAPPPTPAPR